MLTSSRCFPVFYDEVLETIRHGVADKVSPDNMVLEINASKYVIQSLLFERIVSLTSLIVRGGLRRVKGQRTPICSISKYSKGEYPQTPLV